MAKKKNNDPHRPQHIAWRDGQKKKIVMKCLNHPDVSRLMPDEIRGNAGEMVLWAARKLRELAMSGRLNTEPSMFSDKPEEVKELESRILNLDGEVKKMHDLTSKMVEMKTGVFEVRHMPGTGDLEFKLRGATEVKVWGGTVVTEEG